MEYGEYELNLAKITMVKYKDGLIHFTKYIGDKDVRDITQADIIKLKRLMREKGVGALRVGTVIWALRSFMNYCNNFLGVRTINPKSIRPPRAPKREVIFLTKEEVGQFVDSIDTSKLMGLRFRALVEIILGTGMRISEVLSLNRKNIPWESKEAKIIGKGNKERAVFFTDRALTWIRRYLEKRFDSNEAVFATEDGMRRLKLDDISKFFIAARKKAGMDKLITPHILRHTVATNLVFNGCPLPHVKEILGHELLDTTCKYYLGVDKEQAKKAHREYLTFNTWESRPRNDQQLREKRERQERDRQAAEVQFARRNGKDGNGAYRGMQEE
jgi:site-specific recombinase XerD